MEMPLWFAQLKWEGPFPFHTLVEKKDKWPGRETQGSGLYAFTNAKGPMIRGRVLYIGKSDGRTPTLKARVCAYVRRMQRAIPPTRAHKGMEALCAFYRANPHQLYIRWIGCVIARDLEGRLIEFYDPPMNSRDES